MPVRIDAKVDAERGTDAFKKARRNLNQQMRIALREAGQEVALPAARAGAAPFKVGGTPIASTLRVRSTARSAYITTALRGKFGRAVGLLEFGGTVSTPILPKKRKAVLVGGQPVAAVTTVRRYPPRLFLTTAIHARHGRIEESIKDKVTEVFTPEFEVD